MSRLRLFSVCLCLGFSLSALPAAGTAPAPAAVPFFWGFALDGYPITAGRLEQVEQETGLIPQLVLFYLQWPASPQAGEFPRQTLEAIWLRGAVPCLSWEPMYYQDGCEVMVAHERILTGEYDPYLTEFARAAKTWGKPLLLRFAHEMNLDRYHWGTDKKGYGPKSPEIYRQMFQYVVSLFRREGAHNVLWVFCPNAESIPNPASSRQASWNQARNYYPGDDYVDLLGMDGYNWGTTQTVEKNGWKSQWRSFHDIFVDIYQELRALAPGKPLLVMETASTRQGGQKNLWIEEALATLKTWGVQGVVWFQVNKELDWPLQGEGEAAYLPLIRTRTSCAQQWVRGLGKKN